jgi:hypothetical protein
MKSHHQHHRSFAAWCLVGCVVVGACAKRDGEATPKVGNAARSAPTASLPPASEQERDASKKSDSQLKSQVKMALGQPGRAERHQALVDLGGALARLHPARAADVAKQILAEKGEADGDAYAFVSAFSSDYAALDPAGAAAWAEFLPLSLKFSALTFAAQQWAQKDVAAATAWAESISETSLRLAMLRRIGEEVERSGDLKLGAEWALRLAGSKDAVENTDAIARLWAKADPTAAFQWAARISDAGHQSAAVLAVATSVAERSPQAAAEWIEKFPLGDLRQQAAGVVGARWAEKDPESAVRWLAGLGEPRVLESSIHVVMRQWLSRDRARAVEWIRTAPLSEETKAYLLATSG